MRSQLLRRTARYAVRSGVAAQRRQQRPNPQSGRAAATAGASELPEELSAFRPNVGMCVFNKHGLVFAARRLDDPIPDSWQMPQGGIDPGEAPLEAALRELLEEVSISSVELVAEVPGWIAYEFPTEVRSRFTGEWARFRGQAQRWFLFRFTGPDSEVNLETEHREFRDWRWAKLQELPEKVIPFKRGVYERVAAELGPRIAAEVGAAAAAAGGGGGGGGADAR